MKGEPDFLENLRTEMGDGRQWLDMVLSLMACALLASLVSRMISRPLYSTMSLLMMRNFK